MARAGRKLEKGEGWKSSAARLAVLVLLATSPHPSEPCVAGKALSLESASPQFVRFLSVWALTAVSRLAMCACLAVSVSSGLPVLVPRLASRVTFGCQG